MEVARTSMIHATAPHFLWPFAVRYAVHQLNLWPRVSEPETSPTLWWTGKVGNASVFWVWGTLSLVCNAKASKLSSRNLRCIFLGFPTDATPWQFYHLREPEGGDTAADDTAVTRRSPRLVTPPGFPPRLSLPPLQPAAVESGAETAGAEPGSVETEGEGSGGAGSGGAATGGAASPSGSAAVGDPTGGSPCGGGYGPSGVGAAIPRGTAGAGGAGGTAGGAGAAAGAGGASGAGGARAACAGRAADAGGAGGTAGGAEAAAGAGGASGAGGARATSAAGVGGAGGACSRGDGGSRGARGTTGGNGAASIGGAAGVGGASGAGDAGAASAAGARGAGGAGGAAGAGGTGAATIGGAGPAGALRRLLGLPPAPTGFPVAVTTPPLLFPQLQPHSPLPTPAPYTIVTESLTERREPETRASTPERRETKNRASIPARVCRVRLPRAPAVPSTHDMALRPSSVPQHVVLPLPSASSLPDVVDPPSDLDRASSPTVTRFLATVMTDPTFSSRAATALVAELVDFAAAHRLDYLASLVSDPDPAYPPFIGGEVALGCDVLEDKQEELECLAAAAPHLEARIHLTSPPRALIERQSRAPCKWHDTLRTTLAALGLAPSTADPSLFLRTDTTLPPFYVLVYVDDLVFATFDTEVLALVKAELQERHTCTDLGELRSYLGLKITRDRARCTITLTQSHMVHQVLQRFCFQYSLPQPTRPSTSHSLSAPPSDKSVEPSGSYPELVRCLMFLMTCTRPGLAYPLSLLARYVAPGRHRKVHWDAGKRVLRYLCSTSGMGLALQGRGSVVLTGHSDASWAYDHATQRSSQGYTFSLDTGSVSWRSTLSSSVLGSSCEAEIYAGDMTAQELRWLTYVLTDLEEWPPSPPVLYVDNKAMLALCREQRLEHRTKQSWPCCLRTERVWTQGNHGLVVYIQNWRKTRPLSQLGQQVGEPA
ncbi:unnamed protein product [Closterium sp. NIES-54]